MEKKRKIQRKTFAARADLLESASNIAKKKGYTFYAFVNEILEQAISAENIGVNLRSIIEERQLLKNAKEAGFVLGLENIWNEMADISYTKSKRQTSKCWVDSGSWLARRYILSQETDSLKTFINDLKAFLWNAPDIEIKQSADELFIRIISPRFSSAYTLLLTDFLESALKTYGYKNFTKEIAKGTIRLTASGRKFDD